eukprot:CAMPEP_0178710804 /NCGR_PEP_ID=MMETSP0699-20121125/17978_1 /TAXON_ID=265572 /ORGANISM="Extubocellulus spinifer, Strain CCMP396" /LENGTH=602 /DNA_ID=CAMNT_0020359381 /DNA_START=340 /DNA_END=2151 /DNA_ORIENTATION=+
MALQISSADRSSTDPTDTDHNAPCLRTARNETNAALSRISASMANIDDADRLMTLRNDLNTLLSGLSESPSSGENEELTPISVGSLSQGSLVRVLDYLTWTNILAGRAVCATWRDTARHAMPYVFIDGDTGIEFISRLTSLRSLLPKTRELSLSCAGEISSIRPVVGFKHLRSLNVYGASLSGSHPYLFQMPTLEVLKTAVNEHFEWDLEALSGLPRLKELRCYGNQRLTGSLRSLSSLRGNLTHVDLEGCVQVTGTLADIGDLCHTLVRLSLEGCEQVTGTLNDLRGFKSLEGLWLYSSGVEADISEAEPGDFCAMWDFDVIMLQALTRRLDSTSNHFVLSSVTRLDLSEFAIDFDSDLDLGVVSFFPNLQELHCDSGEELVKGSLRSLRDLQPNLVVLSLTFCSGVTGALSDLGDFPKLKVLYLSKTKVNLDVQNIGPNDFPSLSSPSEIGTPWLVSEVPAFMKFLYQRKLHDFFFKWSLHEDSPDFYNPDLGHLPYGDRREKMKRCPFKLEFVQVGPLVGWRWTAGGGSYYFETEWLNRRALNFDEGYGEYCEDVESKTKENLGPFRGMDRPPATKEEYEELTAALIRFPRAFARSAIE